MSHLIDVMIQAAPQMAEFGVHVEPCTNEASAAAQRMSETETETAEIVDNAGRRGRIVGLRLPLDEEDEEPWTAPPSRRRA